MLFVSFPKSCGNFIRLQFVFKEFFLQERAESARMLCVPGISSEASSEQVSTSSEECPGDNERKVITNYCTEETLVSIKFGESVITAN